MKLTIKSKFVGIIVFTLMFVFAMQMYILRKQNLTILNTKKEELKHIVESGSSIINSFKKMSDSGKIDIAEAQKRAKAEVRKIRYGVAGYLFVYDFKHTVLVYGPHPEKEGRDFTNVKDKNDVYVIRELVNAAKNGGGFVNYIWDKKGKSTSKVSYADKIDGWNWMIGTGAYLDDIENLQSSMRNTIIGILVFLIILLLIISILTANNISKNIKHIQIAIEDNVQEILNGNLDVKINADEINFEFQPIADGFNSMLKTVTKPMVKMIEYFESLSTGKIPDKMKGDYKNDFKIMQTNVNSLIDTMNNLTIETAGIIAETKNGNLKKRADASKFSGEWNKLVLGVNNIVDSMLKPFKIATDFLDDVKNGKKLKLVEEKDYKGEFKIMIQNINETSTILTDLSSEIIKISNNIGVEGVINNRIDAKKVENLGIWFEIFNGVNGIIDNLSSPLIEVSDKIIEMGEGKIPTKIQTNYKGKLLEIKNAANDAIENLSAIEIAATMLNKLSVYDLTYEFKGTYKGLYLELQKSSNDMRDRINAIKTVFNHIASGDFNDLEGLKKVGKRSENDEIVPAVINMMENINALSIDSKQLADAAKNGNLDFRIDVAKHNGKFRDIVQGSNQTIDNLLKPFNRAMKFIEDIADGVLSDKITEKANGDYQKLYNNMNILTDQLTNIIGQTIEITKATKDGNLEKRIDTTNVKGKWYDILSGVNNIIDELLKPVNEAVSVVIKMADGDLSSKMVGEYKGDHVILKNALNKTIDNLNQLLKQVNNIVEQVNGGASQVSDASQSLSQGATEQAASLEEVSSAMTEIGSQSKHNAENSSIASKLSVETRGNADAGSKQMNELEGAMKNINESSNKIKKVIKVIDDIAFQTNLLAINAAVEAARAGVHGKGFAVVASEVRNLAQKSAKAAEETTELIEGSIKEIESGNELSGKTAEFLNTIVEGITKVTDIVEEISAASDEQNNSISQSIEAIEQVSKVTQQNAASSEETASASVELTSQAGELKSMIAKFKLATSLNSSFELTSHAVERRQEAISKGSNAPALEYSDDDFGEF